MTSRHVFLSACLGLTLIAVACQSDDLFTPLPPQYTGGAMFQRYVALGNSITAGFQAAGINDSTQRQSYAVKLAAAMQTAFYRPSLNFPGCPPPIDSLFTASGVPHRLGGSAAPPCALRAPSTAPYLSDVAVPGATTFDPFHSGATPYSNVLTLLILGARSQVQAAAVARPTFVSIWIGNNDVLGAATDTANAGNPAEITPLATFQARYDSMLSGLDSIGTIQGGVLIGVVDVAAIPYFSYGVIYFGAKLANALPPAMTVLPNCAPRSVGGIGDTVLVPFQYGFGLIGKAAAGVPDTLDCTNDHNIEPAELSNMHATVAAYNAAISSRATSHKWAFVDPNPALATLKTDTSRVRPFPATNILNCSDTTKGSPFGRAFTCDGIHPTNSTHRLVAQALQQAINAYYNSAIPAVP
ncbi:MAG TPA: SGNH/GDSL hydrolase family protein [Gemmatimonadales bacterium]|nr:SGNH/GDSL hydrolase family protein [Gemmatimonadales bacterium]